MFAGNCIYAWVLACPFSGLHIRSAVEQRALSVHSSLHSSLGVPSLVFLSLSKFLLPPSTLLPQSQRFTHHSRNWCFSRATPTSRSQISSISIIAIKTPSPTTPLSKDKYSHDLCNALL